MSAATLAQASNVARSCTIPLPGDDVACFALYRTDTGGALPGSQADPLSDASEAIAVSGYGPSSIRSAYKLPSTTAGFGQTVAIVDAYNDPNAAKDLAVYRTHFALPACTTTSGCLKIVNQNGGTTLPANNGGWAQEISLDLDMASAVCPNCHILLVEASSASLANLGTAVNTAVKLGAHQVSNSYGGSEFNASNANYNHPGSIITASAGDSGTGAQQPCSYATVVCVGGTSLMHASNIRGWSETAWSGTGSGCSALVAKPAWQHDIGCTKRSESDVSAVADPNTGVAVYDSFAFQGASGWLVFGGTSVSSPIIASVYALAGNSATQTYAQGLWQHGGTSAFFDVTSGSNGTCSITYICHARVGYDGPTGWGTPNGKTAF